MPKKNNFLVILLKYAFGYCKEGLNCNECKLLIIGQFCLQNIFILNKFFYCDKQTNKILLDKRLYFECNNNSIQRSECPSFYHFSYKQQTCVEFKSYNKNFSSNLNLKVKRSSIFIYTKINKKI